MNDNICIDRDSYLFEQGSESNVDSDDDNSTSTIVIIVLSIFCALACMLFMIWYMSSGKSNYNSLVTLIFNTDF